MPVRGDTAALERLLAGLDRLPCVEVIVATADGERPVGTRASCPDVSWSVGPPGRGPQMNAGAKLARGEWLLFLHADTRLSGGWYREIRHAAAAPGFVAGCFRFALDSPAWQARVLERGVAIRVRWFGLPYGDQALFVRRDVFERLGGFRPWRLMEDIDLMRRLRSHGKLWRSDVAAVTSALRWIREGWLRRSTKNLWLVALYFAGVHPDRLAEMYEARPAPDMPVSGSIAEETEPCS